MPVKLGCLVIMPHRVHH